MKGGEGKGKAGEGKGKGGWGEGKGRAPHIFCCNSTTGYAPRVGSLSDDAGLTYFCLSVCLSVTYIGPKSRTA